MEWWRKYFNADYLKLYKHDEGQSSKEADAVVRMLQCNPGEKILDLACGFGRHSVLLAQKGFLVTGFDLSEGFLKHAKEMADILKVNVDWVQGDMRSLTYDSEFEVVINMFTAFGFFEREDDDLTVLKGVRKALKPGGQFLMDVINREHAVRTLTSRRWSHESNTFMLEEGVFDFFRSRLEINHRLVLPDGQQREANYSFRIYTLTEMLELFNKAGLVLTDVYGDFNGEQYGAMSPRMVMVAQRED